MGNSRFDFVIVGGGIVGACAAEELARGGATVAVLDAGAEPGHATPRAAGVGVPSLRYLTNPDFYQWLVDAQARLRLDIARLEPKHGAFSIVRPIVRALRPRDLDAFEALVDTLDIGRWVSKDDLVREAPGFSLPKDRRYAVDDDGLMLDGARYLHAVKATAIAAGAVWQQGCEVHALTEATGEAVLSGTAGDVSADRVVLATGAWAGTGALVRPLPVRPQRGQLAVLETGVELRCILSSAFYLAPDVDGRVIVGATEEDVGFDERATVQGVARLMTFAAAAMPALRNAQPVRLQVGFRPVSETGEPLVGRVPGTDRIYMCAGHAGHGLLSARATGEGLASGLLHDQWEALPETMCPVVGTH